MANTIPAAAGYGNFLNGDLYPTIFSGHILHELQKASVADQITNTLFEGEIRGGGSVVKIIKAPTLSVQRNLGKGAKIDFQTVDAESIELLINQTATLGFQVDDISAALSNIDLMNMTVKQAVYEMRDSFDSDILSFMTAGATNFTSGTVGFGAGENDPVNVFGTAREELDKANASYEDCFAVVSPTYLKFLQAVDSKLVNANEMGKGPSNIITPARPRYSINGIDVYMSNNVASNIALFGHKDAVSTAKALTKYETGRLTTEGFGDFYKALMVWGRLVVRPEVLFKTTVTFGTLG